MKTGTQRTPLTRLGTILAEEGRRQSWLSEQTGIDAPAISRYVKGLHVPDDRRAAIAEALGRQIDDVFPDEARSAA